MTSGPPAKAGPLAAEPLLAAVWDRESQLRRLQVAAIESAARPPAMGLERMGKQAIDQIKELRTFWYLGGHPPHATGSAD